MLLQSFDCHAQLSLVKTIDVRAESWAGFAHEDGSGYFFELIRAVYTPLGYQVKTQLCGWHHCVLDVVRQKADIVVGVYADEPGLGSQLQTAIYPIYRERNAVAFKPLLINWQGEQSLQNKTLAEHPGYGLKRLFNFPIMTKKVLNSREAWKLLLSGEVDFIYGGLLTLEKNAKQHHRKNQSIDVIEIHQRDSFLGFNLSDKGHALREAFDQALPKLYQQGVVEQLQTKWQLPWVIDVAEIGAIKSERSAEK